MKHTTEDLVKALRTYMPLGEIGKELVSEAADRIEELERANKNTLADLALAVSERTPHDYGLLKEQCDTLRMELAYMTAEVRKKPQTRAQPSMLEIAAMIYAANLDEIDSPKAIEKASELVNEFQSASLNE